jgi:hypothetical protein
MTSTIAQMDTKEVRQIIRRTMQALGQHLAVNKASSSTFRPAASGKCKAHFAAADQLLEMSLSRKRTDRTRLVMCAFDATWMGWNALNAHGSELTGPGDRDLHRAAAARAAAAPAGIQVQLHHAVAWFGRVLARETAKPEGPIRQRRRRQVHEWIASAQASSRREGQRAKTQRALGTAARDDKRDLETAAEALYDVRCARMHGDLAANTAGPPGAMEQLSLAAIALTSLLVAASVADAERAVEEPLHVEPA